MADKSISEEVADILDTYNFDVQEATEKAAKEAANKTRDELKSSSPRDHGDYAKSWTTTKNGKYKGANVGGYTVHNKNHYQLTHLLEKGHVIRNQYGSYGRVQGKEHIRPAEQDGIKEFEELVHKYVEEIKV